MTWRRSRSDLSEGVNGLDVASYYDLVAPVYDLWNTLFEAEARKHLQKKLPLEPDVSVLEVGMGTGVFMESLLRKHPRARYVGVDASEGMVQQARRKLKRLQDDVELAHRPELAQGDALDLPMDSDSFDIIASNYVLDLLPEDDISKALQEFRRVMRPTGLIGVTTMAQLPPVWGGPWRFLYQLSPALLGYCRPVDLDEPVREAELVVVYRTVVTQLAFPSNVILMRLAG